MKVFVSLSASRTTPSEWRYQLLIDRADSDLDDVRREPGYRTNPRLKKEAAALKAKIVELKAKKKAFVAKKKAAHEEYKSGIEAKVAAREAKIALKKRVVALQSKKKAAKDPLTKKLIQASIDKLKQKS